MPTPAGSRVLYRKDLSMALYRGHLWGCGERRFPEVKETPPFHSEVGSGEWGGSYDGIWEIRLCGN